MDDSLPFKIRLFRNGFSTSYFLRLPYWEIFQILFSDGIGVIFSLHKIIGGQTNYLNITLA